MSTIRVGMLPTLRSAPEREEPSPTAAQAFVIRSRRKRFVAERAPELQAVEQRDAVVDEVAERAAELRVEPRGDDRADEGRVQLRAVPPEPALVRARCRRGTRARAATMTAMMSHHQWPMKSLNFTRTSMLKGSFCPVLRQQLRELRDQHRAQHDHQHHQRADHERRIDHRLHHAAWRS